ncbi:uncharacterized protein LOC130717315 [Lotus japonicus]|uniref:uncharacterized protein LOC130717315 n=1 Tax=Lotus japonicus TaxID=34305 RepID=UPI002589F183|nr:uncharacterized protein LOC130717315 [Lotus japonicus]
MGKSRKSKTNVTAVSKQNAKDQETQRFEEAQQILNTPNVVTCVKKAEELSRTTGGENKRSISYIPYGRLLSDIFTHNRLVKALFDLGLHDDLAMTIGDPLNGTKLKRMLIIEKVQIEPKEDTSEEIRQKNYPVNDFPLCPPEMPTRRAKRTISKPSDPKGKGILIEKTKKIKAASKSVVFREPVPEPSPERTPEESYEESQSDDSESSMDSSSGNQEEEVPPRKNVKRKAIIEESSDEETEDDVPLVKRQRIQTAQDEEDVEQDDCEIIENVLQVIRESEEAEDSTDSDVEPIGKRLKLPLKGPLQKKESGPQQTSEKISEVQRERRSKTASDPARTARPTRFIPLSESMNSRDLSFTSPEKTATSKQRQVTISEAEHMDESDHSGIEKNHEIDSTPSGQPRTHSSNASSSNATRTPQPVRTLATSFRPQNLIQLIQEFSEEATRRLKWLYQVTDNQFDASFVDGLWSLRKMVRKQSL